MKKKKWSKPKLIILVKNRPEENVLLTCKQSSYLEERTITPDCVPQCYTSRYNVCCPAQQIGNS